MELRSPVVAVIQARMGSSRLPGKVLMEIAGRTMLHQIVRRVRLAQTVDCVVVATSDQPGDDPIADYCEKHKIPVFRGSETDVLDRFYQAARATHAGTVVRVTGDCPLIDPAVIDRVVNTYAETDCDYASNTIRYTYPDGLDTEVFSFNALHRAWLEAAKPSEREHVTPFLRNSDAFCRVNVENEVDLSGLNYQWSVDTAADLEFVRQVYSHLRDCRIFGLDEVLALMQRFPELAEIQGTVISNEGYYRSLYNEAVAGAAPPLPLDESLRLAERANAVIPGGAQTFSKSANQYVMGVSPMFLSHGKGCQVWDVDGNRYIDYVQGLLPNILGYADERVNAAVAARISEGHSFSLTHPLEIELAERLTRIIPCAEMVRFGKNGSDATSGAVRAARAYTGRDRIACCGYHGWQDWFIGATSRNAGVPGAVRELTHPFPYNDLAALERLLDEHPGEFAAVIMEPVNFVEPEEGYLAGVRDLAHKHGALLIFDEICTGFHQGLGGAQKRYGVTPDMATFGKAMGNGFPISCVVGRRDVMQIFGEVFFSFTFAGDVSAAAAAMAVLDILEGTDALARMESNGRRLKDGVNALAAEAGLTGYFKAVGHPTWSLIKYLDGDGHDSMLTRSLFQQEAVKRGILILATHNLSAAHDDRSTQTTLEAYAAIFKTLAGWLNDPNPARFLEGPMIQPVFKVR